MKWIVLAVSILFFACLTAEECTACSTVLLKRDPVLLLGHNLDELTDFDGFVCINKRDVFKTGCTWEELRSSKDTFAPTLSWISVYGSVTFSSIGRDLPDAGINEAGLAIEEMSLATGAYPLYDIRPRIFQMQWIQYHLDSFRTVEEVIRSASLVVPHGWPWHFFVVDKVGNCATIEYLDGKLVVHTGKSMPITALCNGSYESELKGLSQYRGFGGRRRISPESRRVPRFVRAAQMLRDYEPQSSSSRIDYCFSILKNLSSELTRRSYVIDIKNGVIYFRTCSVPQIRHFRIDAFDFASNTPVRILDLNIKGTGDVTDRFEDYTPDANRRIAVSWVRHVQEMYPAAKEQERAAGGYALTQAERYARYSESSVARHDLTTRGSRYGLTPLYWAAYRGELDAVANQISDGADINERTDAGANALMAAAQTDRLAVVRHLIQEGVNLDATNDHGNDALITAIVFGRSEVAKALVEAGAAVDRRNIHGLTPVHWAAYQGDLEVVSLLLSKGADVEAKTEYGYTPLMAAAQAGRVPVVERLLDGGAEINALDRECACALFFAAANGCLDTARCLIDRGANVNVRTNRGLLPLDIAKRNEDQDMTKLLENAGIKGSSGLLEQWFGR